MLSIVVTFAQTEFVVNTTVDSTQRSPRIAGDAAGNYVVVWTSRGNIFLQRFDAHDAPLGPETSVNVASGGDQVKPSIAMNGRGDFVVAWASFTTPDSMYDIKARLYRGNIPLGSEFLVNTYRQFSQTNPAVTMDSSGKFIVAWDSWYQDGSDRGVYAQRFDRDGNSLGNEFLVNATTAYSQARPAIKYLPNGQFAVVWESWHQDLGTQSGYGVFGRLWNVDGTPATGEFQVNTYTNDYQWFADVDAFDDNSIVVVWCSWQQDGSGGGIVLQRFDSTGQKIGNEVIVNKTTVNYQWMPKIRRRPGNGWAVIWSSWKQDGDREGVFAQFFDGDGRKTSFESQINVFTSGFQWEPDMFVSGPDEIVAVWESWGQTGADYDIIARRVQLLGPEGYIAPSSYSHVSGKSTTNIIVHVVDTLALTGQTYEVSLDSLGEKKASATVRNVSTGDTMVARYPIDRGENIFYLTPVFQGVAVEIVPEFDFGLNFNNPYMVNHSGSTVQFTLNNPTSGTRAIAPIDLALIWGRTDTLPNGSYVAPLDTAIGSNGAANVAIPFKGWDLTDNQKMDMLVVESTVNQRWNPGEKIVFRTPVQYRTQFTNTHAELSTSSGVGPLVMPNVGDTNYIFTLRPISSADRYRFSTVRNAVVSVPGSGRDEYSFGLMQNYPNPFNPTTTIVYSLPREQWVTIQVYNILGQAVKKLVDGVHRAGTYKVLLDAAGIASGVYFYRIEAREKVGGRAGGWMVTRKMLLVK